MVIPFKVQCQHCKKTLQKWTKPTEYKGLILRTMWCEVCGQPQAIRFRLDGLRVKIEEKVKIDDIFMPKKPARDITVRPRTGRPK